jgi:superfamily I DNA/RNA helicase
VDEAQDFTANAFRFLRALAGPERKNDLFIVGDSHQRIYKHKVSLGQCGVNVRGRGKVLRLNYRTTEETRKFAFSLLKGAQFDDLDGGLDDGDGCRSLTHGEIPEVRNFKDLGEEVEFIRSEIRGLAGQGVSLKNVCVVARTGNLLKNYRAGLAEAGLETFEITGNAPDDRDRGGARVATMHRVKGLEFQYVFVAAANSGILPYPIAKKWSQVAKDEHLTGEKCLLYVALTRAQKKAYVTSYGKQSEFLTD